MHSEPKISSSEKNSLLKRVRDYFTGVMKWIVKNRDWVISIVFSIIIIFIESCILIKLNILPSTKKWSFYLIVIVAVILLFILVKWRNSFFIKQWFLNWSWLIVIVFLALINLVIVLFITINYNNMIPNNMIPNKACLPSILGNLAITNDNKCDIGVAIERLGFAIGGVIALLVALASLRRVKALDKTAEAEVQGNIEDRYKNAIERLGNDKSSVRLAGVYGLYYLAKDNDFRRENICDVLCVYIRDITTSKEPISKNPTKIYSNAYKNKPSNDVQSILNILTNKDTDKKFPFKSDLIDLSNAFLPSAKLMNAELQGADLEGADLKGADLQGANLEYSCLKDTNLKGSNLRGAKLYKACFKGAKLDKKCILSIT